MHMLNETNYHPYFQRVKNGDGLDGVQVDYTRPKMQISTRKRTTCIKNLASCEY